MLLGIINRAQRKSDFSPVRMVLLYIGRFLLLIAGLLAAVWRLHLNPIVMLSGIALCDTGLFIAVYRRRPSDRNTGERHEY